MSNPVLKNVSPVIREAFKLYMAECGWKFVPPDMSRIRPSQIAMSVAAYCTWVGHDYQRRMAVTPL